MESILVALIGGAASAGSGSSGGGASVSGDVGDLARRVINGEFGNGDARKAALGDRYAEVQAEVNRILGGGGSGGSADSTGGSSSSVDVNDLARRMIAGEFGNGDARKAALGSNYSAVQARVNEMLGCASSGGGSGSSGGVDVDALARAVINGDYGNGDDRKRRLGSNYAAVQRRVNEMLS